jgi:hypothetical protein
MARRFAATFLLLAMAGSGFSCASEARLVPTTLVSIGVAGRSNGTPWVAADGAFVAVAWGATTADAKDVFVAVSRDAGQTFSPPIQVNTVAGEARLGGEMPPRVALKANGSGEPEIVVLWTARGERTEIKTARSRDGGKTFEAPAMLQSAGAEGDRGWPSLAVDANGVAHAIWLDHRGLAAGRAPGTKHVHTPAAKPANYDSVAQAQKSGLYYANAAASPIAERELSKGVCYCCKTSMAIGSAGEIFAAWRHVYPGDLRDMAFTVSRDGGRSFSDPVRVSQDGWAISGCPDDGPAMAVDPKGAVHIAWPTVINDGAEPEGALFYSSTTDGRTFAARTRIPTLGLRNPSHVQLVADRKGRVMVAWDEFSDGRRVASAREISRRSNGEIEFGPVVRIAPEGPATYPVLASTAAGILAVWSTGGESPGVQARTIPWR